VWNFTGKEITAGKDMIFEDVYLGDSLMSLCYSLRENDIKNAEKDEK
jgi:NADH/NAD ratio-sensing transcriptional regulator Rex